jgi:hypothetical protein
MIPAAQRTPDTFAARCWPGAEWVELPYGRDMKAPARSRVARLRAGAVELVALVPARPDTAWWEALSISSTLVCFVSGRLRFPGSTGGAPFPSAVLYFGADPGRFIAAYGDAGDVRQLYFVTWQQAGRAGIVAPLVLMPPPRAER